jgi:DNA-binding transcriptional MerR regulator
MRFETAQVLEIAGVSKDTLRHWKKILAPIGSVDGRSARYSLSELVSICVIARASQELGVAISQVAKSADWLFAAAEDHLAAERRGDIVYLLPDGTGLWSSNTQPIFDAAITIRIGPILDRIRLAPHEGTDSKAQLALPFERP